MYIFLISYISAFITMVVLDGIWLTITVSKFYRPHLGHLWIDNISYWPAIVLYLIYTFALSAILIVPAVQNSYPLLKVLFLGFLFGFAAYACYDITNQATLKDWPLIVTIIDMLWGATVTAIASGIAYKIVKMI